MNDFVSLCAHTWLHRILSAPPDILLSIRDIPPSNNHYKGVNGHHWFVRPAAVAYKGLAANAFYAKYQEWELVKTPVAVYVTFFVAPKTRIDLDNTGKVLMDSFNGLIWEDDRQIEFSMTELVVIEPTRKQKVRDILETVFHAYC